MKPIQDVVNRHGGCLIDQSRGVQLSSPAQDSTGHFSNNVDFVPNSDGGRTACPHDEGALLYEAYAPGHRYKGKLFWMDTELGCLIKMCEEPPDATE